MSRNPNVRTRTGASLRGLPSATTAGERPGPPQVPADPGPAGHRSESGHRPISHHTGPLHPVRVGRPGQCRRARQTEPAGRETWQDRGVEAVDTLGDPAGTPRNDRRTSPSVSRPATRATYRTLLLKGLAPDEAANLTAFLCGIHVGTQHWKLAEVNRLLFLRELRDGGQFGGDDGESSPGA
jgi:hypothetical protein